MLKQRSEEKVYGEGGPPGTEEKQERVDGEKLDGQKALQQLV